MAVSEFTQRVLAIVRSVPKGKVVSYGQVAVYAGNPRAARGVGWILRNCTLARSVYMNVPWWRVINNKGYISIKGNWEHKAEEQRELLLSEGIEVDEKFEVDMEKYRYLAE